MGQGRLHPASLRLGHRLGTPSPLSVPPGAAAIVPPTSFPEAPQVRAAGLPFCPEQSTRGRGLSSSQHPRGCVSFMSPPLCLTQRLVPQDASGSYAWPPRRGGVWGALRGQGRPPHAEGQTFWGISKWEHSGPVPGCPPRSWSSHSWSSVGENPGSLDIQPGLLLHCSLDRGTKMTLGDSTGDPRVHGSSWTTEKGVQS